MIDGKAAILIILLCYHCRNLRMKAGVQALSADASKGARLFATTASQPQSQGRPSISTNQQQHGKTPKLIVFDLDNTLWTPELYQLRNRQQLPVAGKDVQLFPGAQQILQRFRKEKNVQLAIASRTGSGPWAHSLLNQFGIRSLFDYCEIFTGAKTVHFRNIQQQSGIAYSDMLFFDDARDGRYGNCEPVAGLGVLCCHCPTGLETTALFDTALERFQTWDGSPNTIVECDGSVTQMKTTVVPTAISSMFEGAIKIVFPEKRYGFIQYGDRSTKDIFFHFHQLNGIVVEAGDSVSFILEKDTRTGKLMANNVRLKSSSTSSSTDHISLRAFSMNMPFAALLANGYKDLETRNGTMFTLFPEGTQFLLHVGQRIYPDGNCHLEIMKSGGLDDLEIQRLKSLPDGYGKGMVVAILEVGRTYETTLEERSNPNMQRRIAAYGADSGMRVTEIRRVQYLKRPIALPAQGGVFKVQVPLDALPDDWTVE